MGLVSGSDTVETRATVFVSFDIDGTLEVGDPPGPLKCDLLRRAKELGYVVGTCSDRTHRDQREIWETQGIEVDFVSVKRELLVLRGHDTCQRFIHIGDSEVDRHYARLAGFEFWPVHDLPSEGSDDWIF